MAKDEIGNDQSGGDERGGIGIGRLLGLAVVGGAAAIAASGKLRGKILDALFGAEEEFEYTPSSAVNGTTSAAASAPNGNGASAAKPKAATKKKS